SHQLAVHLGGPDRATQVFEIDLVADAHAGRYDAEIIEDFLPPTQELVAFAVALHFDLGIDAERVVIGEPVHHHRVIDHQIHRTQRVDQLRIATAGRHCITHGSQVDDGWHT